MKYTDQSLPIDSMLPTIAATFQENRCAVLVAPPGAGKSTRVPLALLDAGLLGSGLLLLLEPRRMAARAVAERAAALLGERVGQTVGYHIRFDKCASKIGRILVITEGILTRRLIQDPFLEGISFVVLDEFHERSVHSDLALSFVKELMEVRDDLRLLVMSATLEADKVSAFLGRCPVLKSEGRGLPLTVSFTPCIDDRPLDVRAAAAVTEALSFAPCNGDVLVFMPGEGEIRRLQVKLNDMRLSGDPEVLPLFSAMPEGAQNRVLAGGDKRRVVIATNIAETSLTIPKITCVVDSGIRKIACYDPAVGLDRLETTFISQSSADQRAGRAGRIAPGHVIRLWTAHEHKGRPISDTAEILRVDTAPVLLQIMAFHPGDPREADLLERPDAARMNAGLDLLEQLGAVDRRAFQLTETGRRLVALPVHPRLGAILLRAEALGVSELGAAVAALASERDILDLTEVREIAPSLGTDFDYRLDLFRDLEAADGNGRAACRQGLNFSAVQSVKKAKQALTAMLKSTVDPARDAQEISCGRLLLAGFPDRAARLRRDSKQDALMVGGRGVWFPFPQESSDALFVVIEADAGPRSAASSCRIRTASEIALQDLKEEHPTLLSTSIRAVFNPRTESVAAWEETRFIDLIISEKPAKNSDPEMCAVVLAEAARQKWPSVFSPDKEAVSLINRIRFAARIFPEKAFPDVSESGLSEMLTELCLNLRSFADIRRIDWRKVLRSRIEHSLQMWIDREIPERITVPSGSDIRIVYEGADKADGAPPHIACRMQELFGLLNTPRIAEGKVALVLHLLAPSMRPCQVTQDLRSFWKNTYPEARKELKGRYPKHYWPEDPFTAEPTARVRPRNTEKKVL